MRPNWVADPRLPALVLLLAALAVWSPALVAPFHFDDWNVIVDQPAVHSPGAWWSSMPGIRPLLKLSYALDWQASAGGPFAFHLTNLLLHGANTLLVYLLVGRWPGLASGAGPRVAFAAALVFALHPVQGESVAYVSGRSMALMAFFGLGAFLCWVLADERRSRSWRFAALACFAAALAARETALALPLALWIWQRAAGLSWREAFRGLWPWWASVVAAAIVFVSLAGYRRLLAFSFEQRSPIDNLAHQADAFAYYLMHPLFLLQTNIDPAPTMLAVGSPAWWSWGALIVGLLAAGFVLLRRYPLAALSILWPFALLLPTNSLVPRLDLVADRHLHLALIGPAVLLVALLDRLRPAVGRNFAIFALVLVLAGASYRRVGDFASETSLWTATAERSPGKARVWNNLGYGRLVEGDPAGAADAFRRALAIDPDYLRAAANLGRAEAEAAQAADRRR